MVVEEPILADGMNSKGGRGLPRKIETGACRGIQEKQGLAIGEGGMDL